MTYPFHPNARFKVVTVKLLVPAGDPSYVNALNTFQGDCPDQLIDWKETETESMSRTAAEAVWTGVTGERLTIDTTE